MDGDVYNSIEDMNNAVDHAFRNGAKYVNVVIHKTLSPGKVKSRNGSHTADRRKKSDRRR